MDARTEELIRIKAFELSQLADRADMSDLENWLDAEKVILVGLAEDSAPYDVAVDLSANDVIVESPTAAAERRRSGNGRSTDAR